VDVFLDNGINLVTIVVVDFKSLSMAGFFKRVLIIYLPFLRVSDPKKSYDKNLGCYVQKDPNFGKDRLRFNFI
jgi:hypothetical protein